MQQPGAKREMGGQRFKWGAGHHLSPAGHGPARSVLIYLNSDKTMWNSTSAPLQKGIFTLQEAWFLCRRLSLCLLVKSARAQAVVKNMLN